MDQFDRHFFALTYAAGTYVSYLVGPMPQLAFPIESVLALMGGTYALAYVLTYLKPGKSLLRKIGQAASVYLMSFYVFWVVGSFVLNLSDAPIPKAIAGMTLTFLIGFPVVMYKVVVAAFVAITLQYALKGLRKTSI